MMALSYQQKYVWLGVREHPGSPHSNIDIPLRLGFDVDPELLESCLRFLVHRHEALRTAYGLDGNAPRPLPMSADHLTMERVDLSSLDPARGRTRLHQLIDECARQPIPADGLPVTARLIRLSQVESILALTFHHLACDGASLLRLIGELAALYESRLHGDIHRLEPLCPYQYSTFTRNQRTFLQSDRAQRQMDYWRAKLAGKTGLSPQGHLPRPDTPPTRLAVKCFLLDSHLISRIEGFCRDSRKSPFVLFLTALNLTLRRQRDESQVMVASVFPGHLPKTRTPVGYLANIVILQTDFEPGTTAGESLSKVTRTVRETVAHQDIPLLWILDNVLDGDIRRLPSVHINYIPVDKVLLSFTEFVTSLAETPKTEIAWTGIDFYDLGFRIVHSIAGIQVECRYDARFLSDADIKNFWHSYLDDLFDICAMRGV